MVMVQVVLGVVVKVAIIVMAGFTVFTIAATLTLAVGESIVAGIR